MRWHAVVKYRTDSGVVDVHHDIEELEELQNLVERGPDWNTVDIVINSDPTTSRSSSQRKCDRVRGAP